VYYKNKKGYGKHAVVGKLLRSEVEDYLKSQFGIEAETHNGFFFLSDGAKNTYKKNGQSLTHQQVMEIIIPEDRRATAE